MNSMSVTTNKPSLTIVGITGAQSYATSTTHSIKQSYLELQDKIPQLKGLLISPEKPINLPGYIQHISCKPFSYLEYNLFLLYGLGQLIETDFVLIVQNDGWVLNGNNWRDEFFDYDYIGAPLPDMVEVVNNQYIRHFELNDWAMQHSPNYFQVQNGGFSLRSRRLLNAPREYGLRLEIAPFAQFKETPISMEWEYGEHYIHAEDLFLTAIKRRFLEEQGFHFAPIELACYFSVEYLPIQHFYQVPLEQVMGLHMSSTMKLINSKTIEIMVDIGTFYDFFQNPIIQLLQGYGYSFIIPSHFCQAERL